MTRSGPGQPDGHLHRADEVLDVMLIRLHRRERLRIGDKPFVIAARFHERPSFLDSFGRKPGSSGHPRRRRRIIAAQSFGQRLYVRTIQMVTIQETRSFTGGSGHEEISRALLSAVRATDIALAATRGSNPLHAN